MPQPAHMQSAPGGDVAVTDGATVSVSGAQREQGMAIARQFALRVGAVRGLNLNIAQGDDAISRAVIAFDIDADANVTGDEGYRIAIGDGRIRVTARTPQGLFYGAATVWQLLTPAGWKRGETARVANGNIEDHPRFAWRGLLLDSGRHFQSVQEIEKLIDWMSLAKLDVLLWHLTEDQGWRLAIAEYPELTKTGACRKAVGLDIQLTGSANTPYCGFYSEAQVREIVRYAGRHFVTVVPGIDIPGHSQAAVASYPWLGVTGERPPVWTEWGVSPWLLNPDEKSVRFVEDVLDEVMRLFPSRYISLGGDEADKAQWNASPQVRAQMRALGLANMDQLQGWFTGEVAKYLVAHGRTPLGWDDELLAGTTLPAPEIVMSWHGQDGARVALQAIAQGHDVIMSPQESLYFDHYQSTLPDEWPGQPEMITLRQAYDTNAVPQGATDAQAAHVRGVQGQLWTELMTTFADDMHALFPRVAALSEVAWSPAGTHDWNGFLARMPAQLARYRALGIDFGDGAFAPAFALSTTRGALQLSIAKQANFGDIRYTTDGSAPRADSRRYVAPLTFSSASKTTLRAATFAPDGTPMSAPRAREIGASALTTRTGSALDTCSGTQPMRLARELPNASARAVYAADVGNMCWLWKNAPLDGIARIRLTVARLPWQFGDERAAATVRATTNAEGEFEIRMDGCKGALLATLPLTRANVEQGEATLTASVASRRDIGAHALCIVATGDPTRGQWAIDSIELSPNTIGGARD